jgi:hypothetical protein
VDPLLNKFSSFSVQPKRKHFIWEVTQFDMDLKPSNATLKKIKAPANEKFSNDSVEAFPGLNLIHEYVDDDIRNSLITYLEDTFSENRKFSQGINTGIESEEDTELPKQNAQEEYVFSLEQSQKLFNNLQGFVEMSMQYESRKSESELNTKMSSETEDLPSFSNSLSSNENVVQCPFTKLSDCTHHQSTVTIFVVVLQVNPIKEIKIKSGINCGQFVKVRKGVVDPQSRSLFLDICLNLI